ncbi:MAG: YdcF family protein [Rhodospirillaceae bacterium]|nr:YdcF family protein [Rhodospirillaceae bacterium]
MRDLFETLLRLPMPFMLCAALGLLCWPWPRLRRALFAIAALGPLALGMPAIGKALLAAQLETVSFHLPEAPPTAILVPTGGMYKVGDDEWWPSAASVERLSKGLALAERYGWSTPVLVSGGTPWAGAPVEAEVLVARAPSGPARLRMDGTARNTAETADAVRRFFPTAAGAKPVILAATDRYHAGRMAAALRDAGFVPIIALSDKYRGPEWSLADFMPQPSGLFLTARVLRSWAGLIWYWIRGEIALDDLVS